MQQLRLHRWMLSELTLQLMPMVFDRHKASKRSPSINAIIYKVHRLQSFGYDMEYELVVCLYINVLKVRCHQMQMQEHVDIVGSAVQAIVRCLSGCTGIWQAFQEWQIAKGASLSVSTRVWHCLGNVCRLALPGRPSGL